MEAPLLANEQRGSINSTDDKDELIVKDYGLIASKGKNVEAGDEDVHEIQMNEDGFATITFSHLVVLVCICLMTFGSYWVYDTPGALQKQLTKWFGGPENYTSGDNLLLYSVYSWPNTVLALFGGFLLDMLGMRKGALLFCFLVMLGEGLFAIGIQFKMYELCVVGRFVFGLGGESLTVAQNTFCIRWFESTKYLALSFGLVVGFSRIGSAVNFVVTPRLTDLDPTVGVPLTVWFGFGTTFISFLATGMLCYFDYRGRHLVKKIEQEPVTCQRVVREMSNIKEVPLSGWVLALICGTFYTGCLVFYGLAGNLFESTGVKFDSNTATLFVAIPSFVGIVGSPACGLLLDKVGRALYMLIAASFMLAIGHVALLSNGYHWFGTLQISPIFVMIWIGIAYSLAAASMWPILALVVSEDSQGMAYGMMTAVQNTFLAVMPLVAGQALSDQYCGTSECERNNKAEWLLHYLSPEYLFIATSVMSALLTMVLLGIDKARHGGILNSSAGERKTDKDASDAADAKAANDLALRNAVEDSTRSYQAPEYHDYNDGHDLQKTGLFADDEAIPVRIPPRMARSNANIRGIYLSRLGVNRAAAQFVPFTDVVTQHTKSDLADLK